MTKIYAKVLFEKQRIYVLSCVIHVECAQHIRSPLSQKQSEDTTRTDLKIQTITVKIIRHYIQIFP